MIWRWSEQTWSWGWSWLPPLLVAVSVMACSEATAPEKASPAGQEAPPVSVYAVNYPLQYFAERIGGEWVRIDLAAPSDGDPAFWTPAPEVIAQIQGADLILLNGAGYAAWVQKATLPSARSVDTSSSFEDRLIPLRSGPTHSHGPEGDHSHDGVAFTTWLDPLQAIEQAKAVAEALAARNPAGEETYRSGLESLRGDLQQLDRRLGAWAESLGDEPLLFSHPVYQYFERRYDLNGASLHWEPESPPSEEMWTELELVLAEHPARWMIWEDEPLVATAARLTEMGIESLVVSPAASPEAGDFLDRMNLNATELEGMIIEVTP